MITYIVKTPNFYTGGIKNYLRKNKIEDKIQERHVVIHTLKDLDVIIDLPSNNEVSVNLIGTDKTIQNNSQLIKLIESSGGILKN